MMMDLSLITWHLTVRWEPGQPVDWTTPDVEYRDHLLCPNCGLDTLDCQCPRSCTECARLDDYCGHLDPSSVTYGAQNW